MQTARISASSYSNTAPLIWSFLYGSLRGQVELILDNAPARSAELLSSGRVDAALVPVIAYHSIEGVRLVPGVCVGAKQKVRSVCLVTRAMELADVRSVALDTSSKTSVALTKIIFREFLGHEPKWHAAEPDVDAMLQENDAALIIGDPALLIADCGLRIAELNNAECGTRNAEFESTLGPLETDGPVRNPDSSENSPFRTPHSSFPDSALRIPHSAFAKFDLAELWHRHTGLGFVFAMWMTRNEKAPVNFGVARDEGLARIDEIVSNYSHQLDIDPADLRSYLSDNISYTVDDDLRRGMELYFQFAKKHALCENMREVNYTN